MHIGLNIYDVRIAQVFMQVRTIRTEAGKNRFLFAAIEHVEFSLQNSLYSSFFFPPKRLK